MPLPYTVPKVISSCECAGGFCPENSSCVGGCNCPYEAWSFKVTQWHIGYNEFTCDKDTPIQSDTRYLKYSSKCTNAIEYTCNGSKRIGDLTITTKLDEYTGLACTIGLENRTVYCGGGTADCEETCSPTSKSYTCTNPVSDPCDCEGSTTVPKEGESTAAPSTTYSLSEPNTIHNVITRARNLLTKYGISDLPGPNTSGEVAVGSNGQSVLKWSSGVSTIAISNDSRGVVELTKCIIKLKRNINYKIITIYSDSASDEEEFVGVKDQIITLNPNSGGVFSQEFVVVGGSCTGASSAQVNVNSTTDYSTKTLKGIFHLKMKEKKIRKLNVLSILLVPIVKNTDL